MKATVALWAVAFFTAGSVAEAGVAVSGIPEWLERPVERSLDAVWKETAQRQPRDRERVVSLVARRLFPGLDLVGIHGFGEDLDVAFQVSPETGQEWETRLRPPELPPFLEGLFLQDISGMEEAMTGMLDSLPVDVLRWAGEDFRETAGGLVSERIPGWRPSFVFSSGENRNILEVGFTPREPVVVAFSPRLSSRSLPLVLQSKLQEETLDVTADIIGLPAAWIERHKNQVEGFVAASLEQKWAARELEGKVKVDIGAGRIAPVDVEVESTRYTLQAWLAVYLASDARYPEVGIHAGRRMTPFSGWDVEAYGQFVTRTNDGDTEVRIGLRWTPWRDVWVGIEHSFDDEAFWGRISFDRISRKFYAWGRFREDGESQVGLGWRIGEHLSWEFYYDSRDDDNLSLRIIGNL